MNENDLHDVSDEEFFEIVRNRVHENGRDSIIAALMADDVESAPCCESGDHDESPDSDDSDDSIGDSSESTRDSDADEIDSVEDDHGGRVKVHDPIIHDHYHCPPIADMLSTFRGVPFGICDCEDFCLAYCFQENNYEFLKSCAFPIDFDEIFELAVEGIQNNSRKPNNEMRKYYYKKLFLALDFGVLEKGERRRLPNCGVAKIRQLFPSETGYYMGFKEN